MNQPWKIHINYLIYFNAIFYLICVYSCKQIKCKSIEYEKFKIDTIFYLNNHLYQNKYGDTINMKCIEKIEYNKKYSSPSIASIDECNNGIIYKYQCQKLNINYSCSFIIRNNRQVEYSINSHYIGIDTIIKSNMDVISFKKSIHQELDHDFKSIEIKKGKLITFLDCKGVEWTLKTLTK
jgi:hypothetical protein